MNEWIHLPADTVSIVQTSDGV